MKRSQKVHKIAIKDNQHWHELRSGVIGSSDISSLFGMSMYKSKFTLWHEKAGNFKQNIDNNRISAGNYLEGAIAHMVADREGLSNVFKSNDFYERGRLGATPDFIGEREGKPLLIEIKNMDFGAYKDKCPNGSPPKQYILQLQHQMHCTGISDGILAILVGGNDLKVFSYTYRPSLGASMDRAAKDFFQSILEDQAPDIDSAADLDVVKAVVTPHDNYIDLSKDNEAVSLCHDLQSASAQRKHFEKLEKIAKAKLLQKMDGFSTANAGNFNIKLTKTADNKGTIITGDMVGQTINARKGALKLTLKEKINE